MDAKTSSLPIGARDIQQMTPQQRGVYDAIASGPRGDVPWPFLAMLDVPKLADAIQAVGAALRFASSISAYTRELATLATAGAFGSGYEWDYHAPIARKEGLSEATIRATLTGDVSDTSELDGAVIMLCREAVMSRRFDAAAVERVARLTDREIASTIVAIIGYYQLLALFLSAASLDHPPPSPLA